MDTLVGFFLILTGLFELSKLFNRSSIQPMLAELEDLAKEIKSKKNLGINALPKEKMNKFIEHMIYLFIICFAELTEIAIILFATVYFTGTFRILIFSVFLLGFVSAYLKKILPKDIYEVWIRLDYLYCGIVLIGGTLYFV